MEITTGFIIVAALIFWFLTFGRRWGSQEEARLGRIRDHEERVKGYRHD